MNILNSFLEKNIQISKECQPELNTIIKLLIEKCYSSSKQSLKDKSKDMIISFIEYLTSTETLVDNLITIMQSRNQKMSQGGVSISTIILTLFGDKVINYKKLSSALTALSDKCSPLIKQNIVEFFVELYKWIKKQVYPLIDKKVKDTIKKDIEKGIEQIEKQFGPAFFPDPTKFIGNKMKSEKNSNKNIVEENGDIVMNDQTEIDIFTKKFGFDDKFVEKMLKPECKWKEKKDAFDQLTELLNPEKLKRKVKNTNRLNFMDMVKQLLKQPNQSVKHSIIRSMGNLCLALGNNFTVEAKELFPRIIENLSINKISIINDIISTLINFSKVIDNNWISEALVKYGSKSNICNIAKTNLCSLIEKLLDNQKNNNDLNCYIPTIKDIVIKYMDDHSQEIRNTSAKLMSYIKNTKINLFNNNVIKKELNPQKIKKIEEFDKGMNKLGNNKSTMNNINTPNVLDINNNMNNFSTNNNENINENNTINNNNNNTSFEKNNEIIHNKKIFNKNNNKSRNDNRTKISSSVSADNININIAPIEEIDLSNKEDIINTVKLSVGENLVNLFESKKWQEKKQGYVDLKNYFLDENNCDILNTNCDYFLKFILLKNKSFKENNIVIFKESLLCINTLIEVLPQFFSKKFYIPLLKLIIERLSERKIQTELTLIFENLISKTSPKEIILSLMKNIRDKTVPILNGGAVLINNLIIPNKDETNNNSNNNKIRENINLYPIREIIEFCCFLENNTNTQCRNSGTNILCSLYTFLGNNIKPLLKDLKESTMKSIEEKFEKIQVITPNNNTSTGKISTNILEQVFPRIDISKKITPNIIKVLNEGKWTDKKEMINNIENIIISTNNKIQPKGLNELFNSIKFNLKDSNKNIVKMIMKLIEDLAASLGKEGFRQYQKQIIPGIISNFADKNTQVKEESIKCIVKLISIMGFDSMAVYFPNYLNIDNYEMKHEILNILIKNKNFIANNKKDLMKEYAAALLNCLLDKNGIIRTMAEEISQEIVKYHGIQVFNDEIKNLKTPTVINQVKLILNRISKIVNLNNENINNNNSSNNNNKKSFKSFNRNSSGQQNIEMNNEFINNNNIQEVNEFKLNNNLQNNTYDMMNNLENNMAYNNINNIYNQRSNIFNNINNMNTNSFNNNTINMINQNILNTDLNFRNLSLVQQSLNESNDITFILKQLYSSNINTIFQSLYNLQNIIKNNDSVLTNKTVEEIFIAFNTLLSNITKNLKSNYLDDLEIDNLIESNQDIKLLKYLLDVYSLLSSQYNLMNSLNNETIVYECYERLFIIITEKSLISYQNGTNLIQNLNSIIMNFFSNCNVSLSICSLIKLALNYKSASDDFSQVCTLAIKGLDKFRNFIPKLNNILDMKKIFETLFIFFSEYEKTNINLLPHNINEENTLNIINMIIAEFIKIYGDKIWGVYHASLDDDMKRIDIHFKRSIEIGLKEYNQSQIYFNKNTLMQMANKYNFNNNLISDKNNIVTNNNENINNISEDKTDIIYYVNKLKDQGTLMTEEEKNKCYNEIVSLLHEKNEPITSLSTQLDKEYYSKLYELYHSSSINNKENNPKNNSKPKLSISNGQRDKQSINKNSSDFTLTEQAKRIQEYKNKFNSLTERTNVDNNNNDIFSNKCNNFNFKGKINDENNQINGDNDSIINNNILFDLENRKRQLDELSKGNNGFNSKSIFNSQSDIPVMNTSYLTGNIFGNNNNNYSNLSINNDNNFMSQSSKNYELVKNMKKNLDHIRLRVTKNLNK